MATKKPTAATAKSKPKAKTTTKKKAPAKKQPPKAAPRKEVVDAAKNADLGTNKAPASTKKQSVFSQYLFVLIGILIVAGTLAMLWWRGEQQTPTTTVEEALWAIENQNLTHFESYVDISALTKNVVQQVLPANGNINTSTGLPSKLKQSLQHRLNRFIQPELASGLGESLRVAIQQGPTDNLSSGTPQNLFERLLIDLTGGLDNVDWQGLSTTSREGSQATATLVFKRKDLSGLTVKLPLQLIENDLGSWEIVGISNLKEQMSKINTAYSALIEQRNATIFEKMDKALRFDVSDKSSGLSKWGVGKGVMLQLNYTNTSEQNIARFVAQAEFFGPTGQSLKTYRLAGNQAFPAGSEMTQSWPLSINPLSQAESQIFELPIDQLNIVVKPVQITFEDGTTLQPVEELN